MRMPFSDSTFDAIFAIEATCHAPDLVWHLETHWVFQERCSVVEFGVLTFECQIVLSPILLNFLFGGNSLIATKKYTECWNLASALLLMNGALPIHLIPWTKSIKELRSNEAIFLLLLTEFSLCLRYTKSNVMAGWSWTGKWTSWHQINGTVSRSSETCWIWG